MKSPQYRPKASSSKSAWTFTPLKALGEWKGGGTPSKSKPQFWNGNIPWVSPKDFKSLNILSTEDSITIAAISNSATNLIESNSIIIVLRSGILRHRVPVAKNLVPVAINQDVKALTVNGNYDVDFIFHSLLNSESIIRRSIVKVGTTVESIDFRSLKDFRIPVPPTKSEQTAIATALSNADALIASLEKLIAKKRLIKQGVMQKLFEPKKGLKVTTLGEAAFVVGGGTPSTNNSKFWNGGINWFTPTEIGHSKYVYSSQRKITPEGLKNSSARLLPAGTVLLTSRAGIGDVSILKFESCTNQGFQSLIAKQNVDNEYLYYLLLTLKNTLLQNASGSTFLEISPSKVKSIEVYPPDYVEQIQISNILSDIDREIDHLENKLSKIKTIKHGMMQTLLTGKIRII